MAAAVGTVLPFSPLIASTSMYSGSSVVQNETSDSDQPCSSRLPWSMFQAWSACPAPSEIVAMVRACARYATASSRIPTVTMAACAAFGLCSTASLDPLDAGGARCERGELGAGPPGAGAIGAGTLGAGALGAGTLGAGTLGAGTLGAGALGAGALGAGALGAGALGAGPCSASRGGSGSRGGRPTSGDVVTTLPGSVAELESGSPAPGARP